jgi:hypothetical protein
MAGFATRLAHLSPGWARMLLATLLLMTAIGIVATSGSEKPGLRLGSVEKSDAALYRAIIERTAAKQTLAGYYDAAIAEQRARHYPLRPFVAVREPTLALLSARLGSPATLAVFRLLALVTLVALIVRMGESESRPRWFAASTLAGLSIALVALPALALWHEAWAALLVTLSLAVHAPKRWRLSCLIGVVAVLFREIAAPYLFVMGFAALAERRRAEAMGWAAAILLLALAMATHAYMVAQHVLPTDPASPGWARFGGWRFILSMAHDTGILSVLPLWTTAVILPLALLGWSARGDHFTDRVALMLLAFVLAFMLVGRPDNEYWGLMLAPLILAGLAFAPAAIMTLTRSASRS